MNTNRLAQRVKARLVLAAPIPDKSEKMQELHRVMRVLRAKLHTVMEDISSDVKTGYSHVAVDHIGSSVAVKKTDAGHCFGSLHILFDSDIPEAHIKTLCQIIMQSLVEHLHLAGEYECSFDGATLILPSHSAQMFTTVNVTSLPQQHKELLVSITTKADSVVEA